jgi:hypothetical protein
MRTTVAAWLLLLFGPVTATAQSSSQRVYLAATTAVDAGDRGDIRGGTVPSVGLLVGVRLTDAWSVEAEIEKPFRTTSNTSEAFWVSYPPSPNASREDFERYGIKARFDRSQTAEAGWSAFLMWRTREPGRVNAGIFGGVSARTFTSRTVRTTTFVSPLIDLPPTHPSVLGEDSLHRSTSGGVTGGVAILVRTTDTLTLTPEFRFTKGFIRDDPYTVFRVGMRAAWSF